MPKPDSARKQGIHRVRRVSFSQGGYPARKLCWAWLSGHLGYAGYPFSTKDLVIEETQMGPHNQRTGERWKTDTLDTLCTLFANSSKTASITTPARQRTEKRAERRLSKRSAQIAVWWSKLPRPRPIAYRPKALELALGINMQRAAASLRWLGWQRIVRSIQGKPTTLWLPPASPLKPRPSGGQRHYPCA